MTSCVIMNCARQLNVLRRGLRIAETNLGSAATSYQSNISTNCDTKASFGCRGRNISTDNGSSRICDEPYVPRRTVMYVPGHDVKKLKKIPNLGTDCAVLECEDGVAFNMKAQARQNIREALESLEAVHSNLDLAVRVNSRSSGFLQDDLRNIIGDGLGLPAKVSQLPSTVLLPKVDTVEDLVIFTEELQRVKLGRPYKPFLLIYIESAQALINMNEILKNASHFSKEGAYRLDGVIFGSDDFIADIGAERSLEAKEVLFARQQIVMMAKAYRLQAIDMVYVDIHDQAGLKRQSEEGAQYGYTGKQVIHPSQLETVAAAFTPSPARVEWASELVHSFEEHQRTGKGAMTFRGQMIDMPLLLQAQNILRIVKLVNKRS